MRYVVYVVFFCVQFSWANDSGELFTRKELRDHYGVPIEKGEKFSYRLTYSVDRDLKENLKESQKVSQTTVYAMYKVTVVGKLGQEREYFVGVVPEHIKKTIPKKHVEQLIKSLNVRRKIPKQILVNYKARWVKLASGNRVVGLERNGEITPLVDDHIFSAPKLKYLEEEGGDTGAEFKDFYFMKFLIRHMAQGTAHEQRFLSSLRYTEFCKDIVNVKNLTEYRRETIRDLESSGYLYSGDPKHSHFIAPDMVKQCADLMFNFYSISEREYKSPSRLKDPYSFTDSDRFQCLDQHPRYAPSLTYFRKGHEKKFCEKDVNKLVKSGVRSISYFPVVHYLHEPIAYRGQSFFQPTLEEQTNCLSSIAKSGIRELVYVPHMESISTVTDYSESKWRMNTQFNIDFNVFDGALNPEKNPDGTWTPGLYGRGYSPLLNFLKRPEAKNLDRIIVSIGGEIDNSIIFATQDVIKIAKLIRKLWKTTLKSSGPKLLLSYNPNGDFNHTDKLEISEDEDGEPYVEFCQSMFELLDEIDIIAPSTYGSSHHNHVRTKSGKYYRHSINKADRKDKRHKKFVEVALPDMRLTRDHYFKGMRKWFKGCGKKYRQKFETLIQSKLQGSWCPGEFSLESGYGSKGDYAPLEHYKQVLRDIGKHSSKKTPCVIPLWLNGDLSATKNRENPIDIASISIGTCQEKSEKTISTKNR